MCGIAGVFHYADPGRAVGNDRRFLLAAPRGTGGPVRR